MTQRIHVLISRDGYEDDPDCPVAVHVGNTREEAQDRFLTYVKERYAPEFADAPEAEYEYEDWATFEASEARPCWSLTWQLHDL